jgi:transposase, IS6 family
MVSSASIEEHQKNTRGGCFMKQQNLFKWRHFETEIILLCVRWYLRYSLSYRDLEEMMRERGLQVDHTTIYRWVQPYAPELDKRCRPHLKATPDSWKVDETSIEVRKNWMYLYRTIDSQGTTLALLLSPTRAAQAAKRFFEKALHAPADSVPGAHPVKSQVEEPVPAATSTTLTPRVIHVDKNAASPKAIAELKAAGLLAGQVELRQAQYLNNLIEQDHRFIKGLVKPALGFFSFATAGRTLQGEEAMHMLGKGQMQGVNKGDITGQVSFSARLLGVAA